MECCQNRNGVQIEGHYDSLAMIAELKGKSDAERYRKDDQKY